MGKREGGRVAFVMRRQTDFARGTTVADAALSGRSGGFPRSLQTLEISSFHPQKSSVVGSAMTWPSDRVSKSSSGSPTTDPAGRERGELTTTADRCLRRVADAIGLPPREGLGHIIKDASQSIRDGDVPDTAEIGAPASSADTVVLRRIPVGPVDRRRPAPIRWTRISCCSTCCTSTTTFLRARGVGEGSRPPISEAYRRTIGAQRYCLHASTRPLIPGRSAAQRQRRRLRPRTSPNMQSPWGTEGAGCGGIRLGGRPNGRRRRGGRCRFGFRSATRRRDG